MRKPGRVVDLFTPLGAASSLEAGLTATLERLVALSGASAAVLVFRPPRSVRPIVAAEAARFIEAEQKLWWPIVKGTGPR